MIEYKGYQVKPHKEVPTIYVVVTAGQGGKIPVCLEGGFTTPTLAKEAIDSYTNKKVRVNDKTSSQG